MKYFIISLLLFLSACGNNKITQANVNTLEGTLYTLSEKGTDQAVGKIVVQDLKNKGISITITGKGLIPGNHGFHLHATNLLTPLVKDDGSTVIGGMAGGHWDPDNTGQHLGPNGAGHRGDLAEVLVTSDGSINVVMTNSKISFVDVKGKSFMVHANPDNYSDDPLPLGGSGSRMYASPF